MKYNQFKKTFVILLVSTLSFAVYADYSVDWFSMDAGGGVSTSGDISLRGVIGQTDTVRMTYNNISLSGGYLGLPLDTDLIFIDGFEQ